MPGLDSRKPGGIPHDRSANSRRNPFIPHRIAPVPEGSSAGTLYNNVPRPFARAAHTTSPVTPVTHGTASVSRQPSRQIPFAELAAGPLESQEPSGESNMTYARERVERCLNSNHWPHNRVPGACFAPVAFVTLCGPCIGITAYLSFKAYES